MRKTCANGVRRCYIDYMVKLRPKSIYSAELENPTFLLLEMARSGPDETTLTEWARILDIPFYKLHYARRIGRLKGTRIGSNIFHTREEIERWLACY
jgi:hypothetical protein